MNGKILTLLKIGTKVRVKLENPKSMATGKRLHGNFRIGDVRWNEKPLKIEGYLIKPQHPIYYKIEG